MAISVLYCTETELDYILSAFAVTESSDDDDTGDEDETIINSCIERATSDVNFKLLQRYPVSILAPSGIALIWVKWCTAYIAAYYLRSHRGNDVPEVLEARYQDVLKQLDEVVNGTMQLPGDNGLVDPQFDETPTVTNSTWVDFFHRTQLRRIPSTSTGGTQSTGRKQYNTTDNQAFFL